MRQCGRSCTCNLISDAASPADLAPNKTAAGLLGSQPCLRQMSFSGGGSLLCAAAHLVPGDECAAFSLKCCRDCFLIHHVSHRPSLACHSAKLALAGRVLQRLAALPQHSPAMRRCRSSACVPRAATAKMRPCCNCKAGERPGRHPATAARAGLWIPPWRRPVHRRGNSQS